MKIGIFLSTTSEKPEKKKYLDAFASGIQDYPEDTCFLTKEKTYKDCDVAVIFGFYGVQLGDQHQVRKNVFTEHTLKGGKKCLFIDADLFKHSGKYDQNINTHVRISCGSIFFDKAQHFNQNSDSARWKLLQKEKGIEVLDYRKRGDHILVCLNSNPYTGKGWSAGKLDIYDWAASTIAEIRKHSDRKILVRFHPNVKPEEQKKIPIKSFLKIDDNISFSGGVDIKHKTVISGTSLKEDCQNAWACVVHNTSASTIPVLQGIPVFTNQKGCPVYAVANHSLAKIENPELIDRNQWLYDTAYCLWSEEEIKEGLVWKRFRPHLN